MRFLPAVALALLLLTGCRSRQPDDPALAAVADRMFTLSVELEHAQRLAHIGQGGRALWRLQRPIWSWVSPDPMFNLSVWWYHQRADRLKAALVNLPIELAPGLIDLQPEAPKRCCEQPRSIAKLRR